MLLDLNGFKQVNDTAGHQAGDVLLQRVAERLLGSVRDNDVVARLGGDEFAILLTRARRGDAAAADRSRPAAGAVRRRSELRIGGSVGIALFPEDAGEYDTLMRAADAAMYEAKRDTKHLGGGCRRVAAARLYVRRVRPTPPARPRSAGHPPPTAGVRRSTRPPAICRNSGSHAPVGGVRAGQRRERRRRDDGGGAGPEAACPATPAPIARGQPSAQVRRRDGRRGDGEDRGFAACRAREMT